MPVTSHRTHPSHMTQEPKERTPLGYMLRRKSDGDYDDFCTAGVVPRHHWYKSEAEAWATLYEDTNEDADTLRQQAESYDVLPIYLDPPAAGTPLYALYDQIDGHWFPIQFDGADGEIDAFVVFTSKADADSHRRHGEHDHPGRYVVKPFWPAQPNSAADADMPAAVKYVADTLAELEWLTHAAAELMRGSPLTAKERDAIQDPLDSAYMAVLNSLGTIAENATAGRQMPATFEEIDDRLQALLLGVVLPEPARTNVTAGIDKALAAVQDIALKQ